MNRCLIAITLLAAVNSNAQLNQPNPLDPVSTEIELRGTIVSANRIGRKYIERAKEWMSAKNLDSALVSPDCAIAYLSDSVQILRASCIKGLFLAETERYKEANAVLLPFLPFCEKKRPYTKPDSLNWIIDGVYTGLARSCTFTGDYRTAIRSAYTALELGLLFEGRVNMQARYADLGIIYYKLRDNLKAIEMYEKALQISRIKDRAVIIILSNIALCYSEMNLLKTAMSYADSAVYRCGEACPPELRLHYSFNYGMIYIRDKSYELAKLHLKNSLKDAIELHELRMTAESYVYLARIHIVQKEYDSAGIALMNAERIARAEDFNEILLDVYRQHVALFSEMKDFKSLAEYQRLYLDQKQILHNSKLAADMVLAEWRMVEQTHENELRRKDAEVQAQAELIGYQQWLSRASILVVGLMLFLITILLYKAIVRMQIRRALVKKVNDRSTRLENNEHYSKQLSILSLRRNEAIRLQIEQLVRLVPDHIGRSVL